MWLLTTNSMRARPTPSAGIRHQPERGSRVGEVQHDLRARFRAAGQIELFGFIVSEALVDKTLLAFGAGDRHLLLVMQKLGCIAGADDRRQARARG